MKFIFGINIAGSPWLIKKLVGPLDRAKADELIQVILQIKRFQIINGEHEILIDYFDFHSFDFERL